MTAARYGLYPRYPSRVNKTASEAPEPVVSATFSTILKPGGKTVAQSAEISGTRNTRPDQVTQHVHFVDKTQRVAVAYDWERNWQQVPVFTRTKHGANHLAEQLIKMASSARSTVINRRARIVRRFKSGDIRTGGNTSLSAA